MKILITGNLGYVGSELTKTLRSAYPQATLVGYDSGFFAKQLTSKVLSPEVYLDEQIYGDVRNFPEEILKGVDTVVQLAAISNDPIGNKFEQVTFEVNHEAVVDIARKAKSQGVKRVVFASSCSVYGAGGDAPKKEADELNPLTAYARSKIAAEKELEPLADENFTVTCHRFATACGFTDRIRLDLVLNDFTAGAIVNRNIEILSDGTPWRPMINTKDMARAFEWSITRNQEQGGAFLAVNTGSNEWNYQIKPLAEAVAHEISDVEVSVNEDAAPDKRSYCVNFDLFKSLAPDHQPIWNLGNTIRDLKQNLEEMGFNDPRFRESQFIRLKLLARLRALGKLNENLEWI